MVCGYFQASVEISCEPRVKKHFRSIYFDNAVVSTCPTSDGNVVIDAFHQFSGVKWLRNKPLNKFEDQYVSCGVSKLAQLWNEQRKLILQDAIFNLYCQHWRRKLECG